MRISHCIFDEAKRKIGGKKLTKIPTIRDWAIMTSFDQVSLENPNLTSYEHIEIQYNRHVHQEIARVLSGMPMTAIPMRNMFITGSFSDYKQREEQISNKPYKIFRIISTENTFYVIYLYRNYPQKFGIAKLDENPLWPDDSLMDLFPKDTKNDTPKSSNKKHPIRAAYLRLFRKFKQCPDYYITHNNYGIDREVFVCKETSEFVEWARNGKVPDSYLKSMQYKGSHDAN
ncbi:hypothetical protein IKF15_02890 [Candidatus Saccharibacteria bacterium]|nr:hypothetical protein [Candidatus Saccharibacteria bacterium]